MYFLKKKEMCCGCGACKNACENKCIEMKENKYGFIYPEMIYPEKCIQCRACEKVCPVLKEVMNNNEIKVYAAQNKDIDVKKQSSSGGVFTLLAEEILKRKGIVYGAVFDEKLKVYHRGVTEYEELAKLRGSKYVQSDLGNCYSEIKKRLINNQEVLFSGTPCQIAGLYTFLRKQYNNLYTIEVVCHGVPSNKVFRKYTESLEKKHSASIKKFTFRNKEEGWTNYKLRAEFDNGEIFIEYGYENLYMKGYIKNLYIRPSCTACHFKNFTSESDILLGDYWGVETKFADFRDNTGVSLMFINTVKGRKLFENIEGRLYYMETDLDHAIRFNPCILYSVSIHKKSKYFYKMMNDKEFEELVEKCLKEKKESKSHYYYRAALNLIRVKLGYVEKGKING